MEPEHPTGKRGPLTVSREHKRATIRQVAIKAGVCKTTIRHAPSGRSPVSDTLRRRLLRAAASGARKETGGKWNKPDSEGE